MMGTDVNCPAGGTCKNMDMRLCGVGLTLSLLRVSFFTKVLMFSSRIVLAIQVLKALTMCAFVFELFFLIFVSTLTRPLCNALLFLFAALAVSCWTESIEGSSTCLDCLKFAYFCYNRTVSSFIDVTTDNPVGPDRVTRLSYVKYKKKWNALYAQIVCQSYNNRQKVSDLQGIQLILLRRRGWWAHYVGRLVGIASKLFLPFPPPPHITVGGISAVPVCKLLL